MKQSIIWFISGVAMIIISLVFSDCRVLPETSQGLAIIGSFIGLVSGFAIVLNALDD